jgi:hypothetical protein
MREHAGRQSRAADQVVIRVVHWAAIRAHANHTARFEVNVAVCPVPNEPDLAAVMQAARNYQNVPVGQS